MTRGGARRKPGEPVRGSRRARARPAGGLHRAGDLVDGAAGLASAVRRDRRARVGPVQRRPVVDLRGAAGARQEPVRERCRAGDRDGRRQEGRGPVHRGRGGARLPGRLRDPEGRAAGGSRGGRHPREHAGGLGGVRRARLEQRRPGHRPVARHARPADGRGRRHPRAELADPAGPGRADPRHAVPVHPAGDGRVPALPRDRRKRRRRARDRLRRPRMLEVGRSGSAGAAKGELPVLRDGAVVATLRASNWKEAATAVVGERRWVLAKHKGELTGRWADEPRDAVRLRARPTSFWRSTWSLDLEGTAVELRSASLWQGTHRYLSDGRRVALSGWSGSWSRRPTLTAEDSLLLAHQVFLLWLELVIRRRNTTSAAVAGGAAAGAGAS